MAWHRLPNGFTYPAGLLWGETAWASLSGIALFSGIRAGLPWLALAAAGFSLWAWINSRRHYRQIADTPTARLASAPQGYVEVAGAGRRHPDYPVVSPLSGMPCLWYEYSVWENDGNRSTKVDGGISEMPFSLDDGSGHALVVPEGAQVITRHDRTWRSGRHKFRERVLLDGDAVYVLGEHVDSLRGRGGRVLDNRRNALLSEWKNDQTLLKKRFDADGDGVIDGNEWENARRAAEAEVLRGGDSPGQPPEIGFLRRPADGRPLLLSNYPARQLAARFRRWSWLHLGIFFAALVTAIQ